MNYYISDLHLFHKNVTSEGTNFESRPFETLNEMHEKIKENWNSAVSNADHVYILGDLSWKENEDAISFVSTLKGNKHLILGNHCRTKDQRFRQLFTEITNYKEIDDVVYGTNYRVMMFHYPIAFWNRQHQPNVVHLYGHVHNTVEEKYFQDFVRSLNEEHGCSCVAKNVGCMLPYMEYTPRTLEEILKNS